MVNLETSLLLNFIFREYEAQNHTAQEVKAEVEMHLQEKEIIEATIPSNLIIGPFWVNTDSVRQNLSKKRKNLSNAVLEFLARHLRKQADDVSDLLCVIHVMAGMACHTMASCQWQVMSAYESSL